MHAGMYPIPIWIFFPAYPAVGTSRKKSIVGGHVSVLINRSGVGRWNRCK